MGYPLTKRFLNHIFATNLQYVWADLGEALLLRVVRVRLREGPKTQNRWRPQRVSRGRIGSRTKRGPISVRLCFSGSFASASVNLARGAGQQEGCPSTV